MPYKQIITDHEMKMALLFYNKYDDRHRVKSCEYDKPHFSDGSLVILGGARRPDIHHGYAENFVRSVKPEKNWIKICEVEGKKEAWRKSNLVIYKVAGKESDMDKDGQQQD